MIITPEDPCHQARSFNGWIPDQAVKATKFVSDLRKDGIRYQVSGGFNPELQPSASSDKEFHDK